MTFCTRIDPGEDNKWQAAGLATTQPDPSTQAEQLVPPLPTLASPLRQVVGKLRVRLSCLWPNTQHSASLPLLGDRAKGAQVVGAVSLSLQACYASTVRSC